MTDETKKIRDEMIAEAWMHAALKTSEFSSNSEQQDRKIFTLGFDAGYEQSSLELWSTKDAYYKDGFDTGFKQAHLAYAALKADAENLVEVLKLYKETCVDKDCTFDELDVCQFRIKTALTAWREKYGEKK